MLKPDAIRRALAHAPRPKTSRPPAGGLQGWVNREPDSQALCAHCADRLIARGCGGLLHGLTPVWDTPVECSFADQHGEVLR